MTRTSTTSSRAAGAPGSAPRTLFDRLYDDHVVHSEPGAPDTLYIDLHLVHEVTSPQAFAELERRGLPVRRPDKTLATIDHAVPTHPDRRAPGDAAARQIATLQARCAEHDIPLLDIDDSARGIVHVVGPELGHVQPGMTVVCGDSHTSTHGAFGCLAFGIGTSEVGHVLATQCLLQHRPRSMSLRIDGRLRPGVYAKDLALAIIARFGPAFGRGHVIEYRGEAVRALGMEGRMTLCNMSIESGARAGLIAPDDITFAWLRGRPASPKRLRFEAAVRKWRTLSSDRHATFDTELTFNASDVTPWVTWGTHPGMGGPIDAGIPASAPGAPGHDQAWKRALRYTGFDAGQTPLGRKVDVVFIGSCTNGRLSDLRAAADTLRGRRVAPGVRAMIVPGSRTVARAAESEGLDRVFRMAGAEWHDPGCSLCIAMNGEQLAPGALCVSTSNRNFEGRQGPGGRTVLASPATAAAAAVAGVIADPRSVGQAELNQGARS